MKANPDKFHLISNCSNPNISVNVDGYEITNSSQEKLLGITIDNKLRFDEHMSKLCKKASQKLHALARVSRHEYRETPYNYECFINSQFGYYPLVWMFHSRSLNNRINRIQERALRIVYNDNLSTFNELLLRDGSVTIHERNIQILAVELYKVINDLAPDIMMEVFAKKQSSKYCTRFPFQSRNVPSFLGPKIWSIVPIEIKEATSLRKFKNKIKG